MKSLLLLLCAVATLYLLSGSTFRNEIVSETLSHSSMSAVTDFTSPVTVYPSNELQVETHLAAHPLNKDIFAATAITSVYPGGYTTGFYRTTNGGTSWTGTNAIKNHSGVIINTIGDPQVAVTDNNRYLLAYLAAISGGPFKIGVSYSTNNGANWTPTYYVPGVDTADKVVLNIDHYQQSPYYGRCYIAYSERRGTYFSFSTDNGTTWSTAQRICPSLRNGRTGACIATGPTGEVYVSWPLNLGSTDYIGFARSTNGGVNWTYTDNAFQSQASGPGFRLNLNLVKLNGLPVIAVDKSGGPRHGTIYATYIERKSAGSPALDTCDIILNRSTDGGITWGPEVRVNESVVNQKSFQLFGQLNVDTDGNLNVMYYDTRDTPTNDSFMVYMSRSTDGGNSFTDMRVAERKFKLQQLPANQRLYGVPSYIGSYIGFASASDKLLGFWYDNHDGQYRAYSSAYSLQTNMDLTVRVFPEGIYDAVQNQMLCQDSIHINVRNNIAPYEIVYAGSGILDLQSGEIQMNIQGISAGQYFIEANHLNSISVWSSQPVDLAPGSNHYDFALSSSACYGNNLVLADNDPVVYAMYSGDVNRDEIIDVSDVSMIGNDAANYVFGNVQTDLNGDGFVDVTDVAFAEVNSSNYVIVISP